MATRLATIWANPIGEGLKNFLDSFNSPGAVHQMNRKGMFITLHKFFLTHVCLKSVVVDLIAAFQNLPAARKLPSSAGHGTLRSDLSRLELSADSHGFDIELLVPLLNSIVSKESDEVIWNRVFDAITESTPPPRPEPPIQQTPWLRNTSSFANSSEHRKCVDDVLKEELGLMYVGIPGFYEAFFGDVASLELAANAVFKKCNKSKIASSTQFSREHETCFPPAVAVQPRLSSFAMVGKRALPATEPNERQHWSDPVFREDVTACH